MDSLPLVFVGLVGLELLLYFFAPQVLATLACIPIGLSRRITLPQEARDRLTRVEEAQGYREAPSRTLEVRRYQGAMTYEDDDAIGRIFPARSIATVRLPGRFFGYNRGLALARIDIRAAGEDLIEMRAFYMPSPAPSMALAFLAYLLLPILRGGARADVETLAFIVLMLSLVTVLPALMVRTRMKRAVEHAMQYYANELRAAP